MSLAKWSIFVLGSVASLAAQAGLVMTESRTHEDAHGRSSRSVMRLSVQGDQARSDMVEMSQDNPMMSAGSYVLLTSGKSEMLIVQPAQKTYMRMDSRDMRGMGRMAGKIDQQHVGTELSDLKVEKKLDEAGPTMLGQPTRHLIYAISYSRPLPNQPIKASTDVKETRELWVTHGLDAKVASLSGFKAFSEGMGPMSGSMAELGEIETRLRNDGFALKSIRTTETRMNLGLGTGAAVLNPGLLLMNSRGGTARSVVEITDLREDEVPADRFAIPKDYVEREMMNPNAGSMPNLDSLPGGRPGDPGKQRPQLPQMPDLDNIPPH